MPEDTRHESNYSAAPPTPTLITPRGIGIAIYVVVAIALGLVTLFVPPLIITGIILVLFAGVLIALYPYFGLILYYLVVIVRPEILWTQIEALRPPRLISAALLLSVLIHRKYHGEPFIVFKERMTKHMGFFIAALFASIPFAFWQNQSFWFAVDFLWLFLYYVLLINILTTEFRIKGFVWLFMLAGGYNAISSAIAYFSGTLVVAQGIERAEGLSGTDPNTLAVSIMLALPFLLFSMQWIKNNFLRLIPLIFLVAGVFTIAITGSRSGVIGIVTVAFLVWLVTKKKMITAVVAILVLIAGWFALPPQYQTRYSTIFSEERDASSEGRIDAWKAGWGMFKANPITGIGVDCFPLAYSSGNYSDVRALLRPHNMYIQIIAELGLVGLVTFGALIWYVMRSNFRLRKQFKAAGKGDHAFVWISYAITTSIAALFVTSIFGHSLFRAHWYVCAALTVALMTVAKDVLAGNTPASAQSELTPQFGRFLSFRAKNR
ncbi:MAG: O-antigen ligase family protein [Candidatus Zixiibacteriota bacterium]